MRWSRPIGGKRSGLLVGCLIVTALLLGLPVLAAIEPLREEELGSVLLGPMVNEALVLEPDRPLELIVRYKHAPTDAEVTRVQELEGSVSAKLNELNGLSVTMTPAQALELVKEADLEWISVDAPVVSTLDIGHKTMAPGRLPRWISSLTGEGVGVAVIDSGIAPHPDLSDNVVAAVDILSELSRSRATNSVMDLNSEATTENLAGQSESGPVLADPYGHGTHVAGIIGSSGSRSQGHYRGVAPGASLVAVRVLDEFGMGTTSAVIAGLEWVIRHKDVYNIRVANLSLGHPVFEPADDRPAGRGGRPGLGRGYRGRLLGGQPRAGRLLHDQQSGELASGHHGGITHRLEHGEPR